MDKQPLELRVLFPLTPNEGSPRLPGSVFHDEHLNDNVSLVLEGEYLDNSPSCWSTTNQAMRNPQGRFLATRR